MRKFKLQARHNRKILVSLLLSFIIALPMLAQPLGLSFFQPDRPAITSQPSQAQTPSESLSVEAPLPVASDAGMIVEPLEVFEDIELTMNRSLKEEEILAMIARGEEIDANYEEDALTEDDEIDLGEDEPEDPVVEVAAHIRYISGDNVNLRSEPAIESESLGRLDLGEKVTCTGETAEWMKVKDAKGREGFIFATYTSTDIVFRPVNQTVYVTANTVNLRSGPSTQSEVLARLDKDHKLTRTGVSDEWSRIKTRDGGTAYIANNFLTITVPASLRTTTKSTSSGSTTVVNRSGDKVVDLAYSMLGVRYVFGSESRSGVDCSGLIYYIYRQIGVSVPRISSSYANFGTSVSRSDMKPGDVIAWDTRKNDGKTSITHVGIYVGGGNMIHASSTYKKVILVSVSKYESYGLKMVTIRRIKT